MDAKFLRGKIDPALAKDQTITAKWIWSSAGNPPAPAGEKRAFRKKIYLDKEAERGVAVVVCDNAFTLFIDGKKVASR